MFGLNAFNRLLRNKQQEEKPVLKAHDALTAKQMRECTGVLCWSWMPEHGFSERECLAVSITGALSLQNPDKATRLAA